MARASNSGVEAPVNEETRVPVDGLQSNQGRRKWSCAELMVDALAAAGVRDCFTVAGSTIMPLLDSIAEDGRIRLWTARHEYSAAEMASGYARASGRLGIVIVHVGPGAINTLPALTSALRDRVPVFALTGNEESWTLSRDPYHSWPSQEVFSSICNISQRLRTPAELIPTLRRVISVAVGASPGPVHIDLPEDVAAATAGPEVVEHYLRERKEWWSTLPEGCTGPLSRPAPSPGEVREVVAALNGAERPVMLVGDLVGFSRAHEAVRRVAERSGAAIVTTIGARDPRLGDTNLGVVGRFGHPEATIAFEHADVLMVLGAELTDIETDQWRMPAPDTLVVHVHPCGDVLNRRLPVALGIIADVGSFLEALADALPGGTIRREGPEVNRGPSGIDGPDKDSGPLDRRVVAYLSGLPPDWLFTMDPGYATLSLSRELFRGAHRVLYPAGFGIMGFAIPAALGAMVARSASGTIALVGDGSFFMSLSSVESIAAASLPVHIVVFDDGGFGSQRQKQREGYEGRLTAVNYDNPDISEIGRSLGVAARRIAEGEDVAAWAEDLLAAGEPSLTVVPRPRRQDTTWYEGVAGQGAPE